MTRQVAPERARSKTKKMAKAKTFDIRAFLSEPGEGRATASYRKGDPIFAQGDAADSLFYIQKGKVKLSVVSKSGKEAVIALLNAGDFFGEGCLALQSLRIASASALSDVSVLRLEKGTTVRVLHDEPAFAETFLAYVLSRTMRIEADLVDQLFNSSEKRLARTLLLLAHFAKEDKPEHVIAKISQETLAEMVGTTRSRVNFFMNKFRRLGFIKYNGGMEVNSSLLTVILHD